MSKVKVLVKSVREFKKPTILTLLLIVAEAVIETLIPFLTSGLVNKIQEERPLGELWPTGLLLIAMALCSLLCGGLAGFTCSKASAGFARNLRHDMFSKIQTYSFENIDKFSSSSLVTRMTTDIQNVQMSYMMIIRTAVRSPLMIIFSVIMAIKMGGMLALLFVIVIPFLVAGLLIVAKFAMPAFRSVFRKYDKLNESIEENVRAMRVVKGFSREKYEQEKFTKASDNISVDFTKAERIVNLNMPIMQICIYFNMIFVLLVGSHLAIGVGSIGVGELQAMLTYGMQILMSLMMLSMIYVMLTMSAESMNRIVEVLEETPSLVEKENAIDEIKDGSIDFDKVSFKYSSDAERFALENINLHIKSGQTVGIIGGTGTSKSTLVQLIPRLYETTEGVVKVGGIDVRDYKLSVLRDSVAMVLQKNMLFSGTIAENLRWGNLNASDEELVNACKIAQVHDYIEASPEGYSKMIEQGGANVSGGQKQRICIARALLKNPKVLIMDDSTSAVDTKTDAMIRDSLAKYAPDVTKIIIAQRVSSVQNADLILVMDDGRISAMGTHEDLLKSSQIYREVYEQQTRGGGSDEA